MKYELIREGCIPKRAHPTDAGMDLRSGKEAHLGPQVQATIPLGIKGEVPIGCCALLLPRSGIGSKGLELMNTAGVIDMDYRGEWIAKVRNKSENNNIKIEYGERIIQCLIVPVYLGEWYQGTVNETKRGSSGFGASGKK